MTYAFEIVSSSPVTKDVSFRSGEHRLNGKLFHPGKSPKAAVVINAATGVRANYYESFARWLAEEKGLACLTYDYRDFGASAGRPVKMSNATMADWGVRDAEAARAFLMSSLPGKPVWVIGHSLGALCIASQRNLGKIDRLIAVASGPVHVSEHPWPYQALARWFWYGIGPLATRLMGYLPGRKLGFGPDLPAGVFWQWRRWCTARGFNSDDLGRDVPFPDWSGFGGDAKYVAISDDATVPPSAVWRAMQFHREAWTRQLVLDPYDYGLKAIGHIGVFHADSKACWDDLIA